MRIKSDKIDGKNAYKFYILLDSNVNINNRSPKTVNRTN